MKYYIKIAVLGIIYFPFYIINILYQYIGSYFLKGLTYFSLYLGIIGIAKFVQSKNPIYMLLSFMIGVGIPILLRSVIKISIKIEYLFYEAIYGSDVMQQYINFKRNQIIYSQQAFHNHMANKKYSKQAQTTKYSKTQKNSNYKQDLVKNKSLYSKWFLGVTDKESLIKRHRDLVKIYHPDVQNGNTETISEINIEYQKLLRKYK